MSSPIHLSVYLRVHLASGQPSSALSRCLSIVSRIGRSIKSYTKRRLGQERDNGPNKPPRNVRRSLVASSACGQGKCQLRGAEFPTPRSLTSRMSIFPSEFSSYASKKVCFNSASTLLEMACGFFEGIGEDSRRWTLAMREVVIPCTCSSRIRFRRLLTSAPRSFVLTEATNSRKKWSSSRPSMYPLPGRIRVC